MYNDRIEQIKPRLFVIFLFTNKKNHYLPSQVEQVEIKLYRSKEFENLKLLIPSSLERKK
jgi:hypothetical protein